ncbi:transcription elongation factor GreB [bacterium]|nr:transcription elongation factor GreB [bacterium]
MSDKKNYITPDGFEKLRAEYLELLNVERPKTVSVVSWAASNGDRSENADYQYGKRRLREIDKRLFILKNRMQDAEVIDPAQIKSDKVVFGAKVTLENEDGEEITYQIVGADEIDIKLKRISWQSPLAKAILGKKINDDVKVTKPSGDEMMTIVDIKYEK